MGTIPHQPHRRSDGTIHVGGAGMHVVVALCEAHTNLPLIPTLSPVVHVEALGILVNRPVVVDRRGRDVGNRKHAHCRVQQILTA